MRRNVWITLLLVAFYSSSLHAKDAGRIQFHIPAGTASEALVAFGLQWQEGQLLYTEQDVKYQRTPAVNGSYTPQEALTLLLYRTGLQAEFLDEDTVTIKLYDPPAATQRAAESRKHPSDGPRGEGKSKLIQTALPPVIIDGWRLGGIPEQGTELVAFDRTEIEQTGAANVGEFADSVPQNFGGGPREDALNRDRESLTNTGRGYGINLRGLGASATLILINGRRLAPSGSDALFTDVSNIPLAAVQRIEIQPDGASALYGADAVGGVVNFIMRDDLDGRETHAQFGGGLKEDLISQLAGIHWEGGQLLASFEYYSRDALWAVDRRFATSNLTPFGGSNFNVPSGNPGTITNGIQTWAVPRGQNGSSLDPVDLVAGTSNSYDSRTGTTVLPQQQRESAFLSLRQKFDGGTKLFADGLFSVRNVVASSGQLTAPLSLTGNPFFTPPPNSTGPYTVLYGFGSDFGPMRLKGQIQTGNLSIGAEHPLGSWNLSGYVGYAFEKGIQRISGLVNFTALDAALKDQNTATAFNPLGDGSFTNPKTLAGIAAQSQFRTDSVLRLLNLHLEGPVWRLRGGDMKLTAAGDYRDQTLSTATSSADPTTDSRLNTSRGVIAGFGELRIPLVGIDEKGEFDNHIPGIRRLDLNLAARIEKFNDFGQAVAPKMSLVWSPLGGLLLRGSVADSFRAPNMTDLVESNNGIQLVTLADPSSPTGARPTLIWFGNNRDLHAETARSWTAGAEIGPQLIKDTTLSLTYFDISFKNRIQEIAATADLLENPTYTSFVTRNPTALERANVCSRGTFAGNPSDCLNADASAIVDLRLQNIAVVKTSGVDLLTRYYFQGHLGKITALLNGTYTLSYAQAQTKDSPLISTLNTIGNPINTRLRGVVAWERRGFEIVGTVNFTNGYRDTLSQPNRSIASFTTADLKLSYRFEPAAEGFFGATTLSLDVRNVLNRATPFVNNPIGIGYDPSNGDLVGRVWSINIGTKW